MDSSVLLIQRPSDSLEGHSEISTVEAPCAPLIFSAPLLENVSEEDLLTLDTDSDSELKTPFLGFVRLLPMKTRKSPRITLVLDLDETLVHSEMAQLAHSDYVFQLKLNQETYSIFVAYRPGLFQFLEAVCGLFEVVVFTASMRAYAEQVLKAIDPCAKLRYKFYREACVEIKGNFVKDLRVLGRELKNVAIIDNSEHAFYFQPENGILIPSWFNDSNDCELHKLIPLLVKMNQACDVRDFLKSTKY